MKKNMGTADKAVRILIAVIIAILFFTNVISGLLGFILLALAVIFVLTSLISFCPLYMPFGINTGKKQE
jgi:hypothetical protein